MKKQRDGLLGIVHEEADGHKRVTQAEDFKVVGGSQEFHDAMTERFLKMKEHLKKKGHDISTAPLERLDEAAMKVGFQRVVTDDYN
jgi:hypothetical protein